MAELTNIQLLRCSDNGLADPPLLDPASQHGAAQRLKQHKPQLALRSLLVARHEFHEPVRSKRWAAYRQACALQEIAHPRDLRAADESEAPGELRGHHHAGGDRLAVQPAPIAHGGLDAMAEGVAEI